MENDKAKDNPGGNDNGYTPPSLRWLYWIGIVPLQHLFLLPPLISPAVNLHCSVNMILPNIHPTSHFNSLPQVACQFPYAYNSVERS